MLSKIIRIKTKKEFVEKPTKIKVTQKDVDDLNRKIRKDIQKIEERRLKGYEIAEKSIMK
ncbi:MAG: hypothetical protein J6Q13_00275 [Clostridia bacterium]|nr:hypothetical protein [Clostridia bacterium]